MKPLERRAVAPKDDLPGGFLPRRTILPALVAAVLAASGRAGAQVVDSCSSNSAHLGNGQTAVVTCTATYSGTCFGQETTNFAQVDAGFIACDKACPNETCQTPNPPGHGVGYFLSSSPAACTTSFLVTAPSSTSGTIHFFDSVNTANACHGEFALEITYGGCQIEVTPGVLPDGTANSPYGSQLSASGGKSPYTFSVSHGSLPAGLSMDGSGVITGTPAQPGTYTFSVQVTDANGCKSEGIPVAITIAPAAGPDLTVIFSRAFYVQRPNGTPPSLDIHTVDLDLIVENVGTVRSSGGGDLLMFLPSSPPNGWVFVPGASGCSVTNVHAPQDLVCSGIHALDPGEEEHFHVGMNGQSSIPDPTVIALSAEVHEPDDVNPLNNVTTPPALYAVTSRTCFRKSDVEALRNTTGRP